MSQSFLLIYNLDMFDGRHCTNKDLDLLIKETNQIKRKILQNSQKNEDLRSFLALINRFDSQIAAQLKTDISNSETDCTRIIHAIDKSIDELKRNVLVDIYEHKKN